MAPPRCSALPTRSRHWGGHARYRGRRAYEGTTETLGGAIWIMRQPLWLVEVVDRDGVEPSTYCFSDLRSTVHIVSPVAAVLIRALGATAVARCTEWN